MLVILGLLVVLVAVFGGYMVEGGHLVLLLQPAEFLIIGGASLGGLLVGTPPGVLRTMLQQLSRIPGRSGPSRQDYRDLLVLLHQLLSVARRDGLVALERHVESPEESPIVSQYPSFLKNRPAVQFFTDNARMLVSGAVAEAHDLESLMDSDLETRRAEARQPASALYTVADALPGLGIVAAVLGIVLTMSAIDGPAEEIGHKVGAALVGTFLGIFLSYGFAQPLARNLTAKAEAQGRYVSAIKEVLLATHKGSLPTVAVEFARRSLFADERPDFVELEKACREARAR